MPVFIAFNYNNYPTSIVVAKNEDLAKAYWHGAGVNVHSHKSSADYMSLDEHPTGVFPILKTEEVEAYHYRNHNGKILIVSK